MNTPKRMLTYKGVTKSISEWAEEYWMPYDIVRQRLDLGWPPERALTESIRIKIMSPSRRHKLKTEDENDLDRRIKRTIWDFKKEKLRQLYYDFKIKIPYYLAHERKVA